MKIKKILAGIIVVACSMLFFACNKLSPKVSWTEDSVKISVGEEISLDTLLKVENFKIADVVFSSLNQNIVTISNGRAIAVSVGNAFVEAKIGEDTDYLVVNVIPQKQKFETVSNILFDAQTNTLTWNKAVKMVDNQPVFADSYKVIMTKDGQTTEIPTTKNSVLIEDVGNYDVSVVAIKEDYLDSENSDQIHFEILETPTNILFDKQTSTLSWQSQYSNFVVSVNDIETTVAEKQITLDLSGVGSYDLKVFATHNNFTSSASEQLTITRLSVPTVNTIQSGVISFERTQQSLASGYKIRLRSALDEQPTEIDNNTGVYTLENKTYGDYYIEVKAVGNEYSFDSEYSSPIVVTKLKTPTLSFDKTTKELTTDMQNTVVYIKNLNTNQTKQVSLDSLTYIFNESVGIYEIYAKATASQLNQIQSDDSSSLYIKKLGAVQNLRHQTQGNQSTILFDGATEGYSYDVYVDDVLTEGQFYNQNGAKIVLEQATDVVFDSGSKTIKIVSYDYTFETNPNCYILNEDATSDQITVQRFAKLTPQYNSDGYIEWESVSNASCYEYQLHKDAEMISSERQGLNRFVTTNLAFGNYTIKVKAIGNDTEFLSSLQYGEVSFSIKTQLQSPNVTFDKTTKKLIIEPVENADKYTVELDNNQIFQLDNQNLQCDISDYLDEVDTYVFYVGAQSTDNDADLGGNLYKSEKTAVAIEKLASIESFTISNTQQFEFDLTKYQGKISGYQIKIDDEIVEDLNNFEFGAQNVLSVKLLANNSTNPYYVDSEEAVFNLQKLSKPQNVTFSDYVLSWDAVENAKSYVVKISKQNQDFSLELTTNIIDISQNALYMQMLESFGAGWSVTVVAKPDTQVVTTSTIGYLSSDAADDLVVNQLETPTLVDIVSNDVDDLEIKIDFSDVENATSYKISIDDTAQTITESELQITDLEQVKRYIITIVAYNSNYINSNKLTVILERLGAVSSVSVDVQQQTFDVDFAQGKSDGVKVNNSLTQLPYDLSEITTTQSDIQLQIAGKKDLENNTMYLASQKSTFGIIRHNKVSNFAFDGQVLTWDMISECDYYSILLENSQNQSITVNIPAKNGQTFVNSFDLSQNAQVQQFLSDSGLYNAKISACVNDYQLECNTEKLGYLSGEYCDLIQLQKLDQPQNIQVTTDDMILQTNVTISWQAVADAEKYFVYVNNILLGETDQTTLTTDKLVYNSVYSTTGNFDICVVADAAGKIKSNKSNIYKLNRLPSMQKESLIVSKNGVFSWSTMQNANEFVTYIEYNNQTTTISQQSEQSKDYSEDIYQTDYSGYIKFYVCAVGDGTRYLSSEYQFVQVLKLDIPKLTILGNSINIDPSQLNPNATFDVKISFEDSENNIQVLQTLQLNSNESSTNNSFVFPEEWDSYNDGEFIFEVVTTYQGDINSNKLTERSSRAQGGVFKGFVRNAEDNSINLVVELQGKQDGSTYHLILNSTQKYTVVDVVPNDQNLLIYPIKETLSKYLDAKDFEFEFYVAAADKINSVTDKISGKRLSGISGFGVKNGVLNWKASTDSESTGYLLRITNSSAIDYKTIAKDVLSDDLVGYSEQLALNIKALGNITTEYKTTDIILDSMYIMDLARYIDVNLTVYKNPVPTDISVYSGYFKLATNEKIYGWNAKIDQNVYTLSGINEEEYFIGTSNQIYYGNQKLTENTLYNVRFQAVGNDAEFILNSDYTDSISIKVLENSVKNVDDIQFVWLETYVDRYYFTWEASPYSNAYRLDLGGGSYIDFTGNVIYIDCDANQSGIYQIAIGVVGSTSLEEGGFYYLSSTMSDKKTFLKVQEPTVSVRDGKLTWTLVDNADKYYVYYMKKTSDDPVTYDDFLSNSTILDTVFTTNEWQVSDSFGSLTQLNEYYFGVRAVSTNYQQIAPSVMGVIGETDDNDEIILTPITKLKSPDTLTLKDGTLLWTGSYNIDLLQMTIGGGISPFVYDQEHGIQDYPITMKFVDNEQNVLTYSVSALKLFKTNQDALLQLAGYANYEFGWPTTSFLTNELQNITPGEHNLTLMQDGDSINWLDSNYNSGINIYIPHAPKITLKNFVLSWDEINLPSNKTLNNTYKYSILTKDADGKIKVVHQTNDTSVDLRDLVNADKIVSGEYIVFVYVNGDDDYYVNGLPSNSIEIKVLPEAVASMEGGVLVWNSVSETVKYNITSDCDNPNYYYEFETSGNRWDMSELLCYDNLGNRLTYNIQVRCIGDGTSVISGKVANVGKVMKLLTPELTVEHGEFSWAQIEENQGYTIAISDLTGQMQIVNLGKDVTTYETKTSGYNLYNIRAIGTTSSNLSTQTVSYAVSSYMENGIYGVMLDQVASVSIKNGRLMWLAQKDLNNSDVLGFKLSFGDVNYYDPIYIEGYNTEFIDGQQYVVYEIDQKFVPGDYEVYVQAYSHSNHVYQNNTYCQLLGEITTQTTLNFAKLRQVSNLHAQNGVVIWDSNDQKTNTYLLTFTNESQKYEFECTGTTWDPTKLSDADALIYKNIIFGKDYKLKVKALGNDSNLLNSDYCDESIFTKIDTIDSIEYREEKDESFVIRWYFNGQVAGITDYHYALKYDNGTGQKTLYSNVSSQIRRGYDNDKKMYYGETNGSKLLDVASTSLVYQVAVLPVSQTNTMASDYSQQRSTSPPKGITDAFSYNSEKRSISWIYQDIASDIRFRIVDELVTLDNSYNLTVQSSDIYLSQSTEYVIQSTGLHRISVCVVLTGESVASPYVYFDYEVATDGLIKNTDFTSDLGDFTLVNFNLFESGDGSSTNPYVITNQSQFENINQRLTRPSYFGSDNWYFELSQDLTLQDVNSITEFGGIFEGNGHTITYNISNTSKTQISLFNTLLANAKIQNLCIKASVAQQNTSESRFNISPFVYENRGTIKNCILLEFNYQSYHTNSMMIYFGGFAVNNYGTIQNCITKADIVFDGSSQQQGVSISSIYVGGIAYINGTSTISANITNCGNDGDITVYTQTVAVGGISAKHVGGLISGCYYKGSIDVALTQSTNSNSYVGGLVAASEQKIQNSYTNCNITINMNNLQTNVCVGGLIGAISSTNGAIVNNCFVANPNIVVNNDGQSKCTACILIGASSAQGTMSQTCSYYAASTSGLQPIKNVPSGFSYQSFSSYAELLEELNNNDDVYISNGNDVPKLAWEE